MDYAANALLANSAGELPIRVQLQEPAPDPDTTMIRLLAYFPMPDGGMLVDSSDWALPTALIREAVDAPGQRVQRGTVAITAVDDDHLPANALPHVGTPAFKLDLNGRDDTTSAVFVGRAVVEGHPEGNPGWCPPR